jgi:hypothetical protein
MVELVANVYARRSASQLHPNEIALFIRVINVAHATGYQEILATAARATKAHGAGAL